MAQPNASWQHERARIATLSRHRKPDDPELLEARANLRALMLAAYAERTVAESPPMTEEQLSRVVFILARGGRS